MYPYIRDLFVRFLDFRAEDVFTDTANELGDVPDVAVMAPSGILDAKGKEIKFRWLVLEAKDEPEVFLDESSRADTFEEKSKYIHLDTVWFAMVDPTCLVLRAVSTRSANYSGKSDLVIRWAGITEEAFKRACVELSAAHAGVNRRLQAFRDGDEEHIAEVKLGYLGKTVPKGQEKALEQGRNEFYLAMRTSAQLLQVACRRALDDILPNALTVKKLLDDFRAAYGIREFDLNPFRLTGEKISGREAFARHQRDVRAFAKVAKRDTTLARLGCFTLPEFLERTGNDEDKALDLLAAETASLLLSRCMMLRFFEDHGFFGKKKYLCNGGVKAFQEMREYYGTSYARLLRESYGEGSKIYAAVFNENELDWVLATGDKHLSNAIERVLFYLSHFDYATIEQDVLSNIYGQFIDVSQRKRLGEHYTPPDIARYIVRRMDLKKGDKIIDPACGLGTFLIEAYKVLVGDAAAKGVALYNDVLAELANIRGNDLNAFSAMVAQMQLLWHLFLFRDDIRKRGFPETSISGGYNSLHHQEQMEGLFDAHLTEFSMIDVPEYAAVVGNPPYVRPERQDAALTKDDQRYYNAEISANVDLYSLFLYKALDGWCRAANGDGGPGKVGFLLPLSFCDNDDNATLRQLFSIGGRWTILEIVDLELIGPLVFGGDVVPIILIAEKRPATDGDRIRLRVADQQCAKFTGLDQEHVEFDLEKASLVEMPYADIFTADGRILTKINPKRKAILDRFQGPTFDDIAQKFWVGKSKKQTIEKWALARPEDGGGLRWEQTDMIRMGAAFRHSIHELKEGGKDVFKGENIVACRMEGDPVERNIDVNRMDDASLWRFADILPDNGFAFHQISTGLTAAPFRPSECVLLNTVSLFFPRTELDCFPFDFLVLSRLYKYFFALSQREAVLFRARCHVYPSTIRRLPWSDRLVEHQDKLVGLRGEFLAACENLHRRKEVLLEALKAGTHTTLKRAVTESKKAAVNWSEELLKGKAAKTGEVSVYRRGDVFVVQPGDDLLEWIEISDRAIAECFAEGLALYAGKSLKLDALVEVPIPTPPTLKKWRKTVAEFDGKNYEKSLSGILDKLDRIVAKAFKIPAGEVAFIKSEFQTDPMLRRVRPNLPFTDRRLIGSRRGLADADRYKKAYKTRK
ncbi:MAG TPA: N-6 DNA methylase [Verrucomicrobiae bacterium]|nr:N-6 DNA methylase [Verrucomicrobiae bacterium]